MSANPHDFDAVGVNVFMGRAVAAAPEAHGVAAHGAMQGLHIAPFVHRHTGYVTDLHGIDVHRYVLGQVTMRQPAAGFALGHGGLWGLSCQDEIAQHMHATVTVFDDVLNAEGGKGFEGAVKGNLFDVSHDLVAPKVDWNTQFTR
jgi:hypothetical protein